MREKNQNKNIGERWGKNWEREKYGSKSWEVKIINEIIKINCLRKLQNEKEENKILWKKWKANIISITK